MSTQFIEQKPLFPLDQIQVDFERFCELNPHVYPRIVELARQAKRRGFKRYSMDVILAILRWHHDIETVSEQPWKLNDHWTSRFARKVMDENPDLAGFFELRSLRSERAQ